MDKQGALGSCASVRVSGAREQAGRSEGRSGLDQGAAILLTNPRLGEQLFQFEPREVRRLLVGKYEMRYEVVRDTIYMLRLWHTREDR